MTDITVVICTQNRAASLQETLTCLGSADLGKLQCEIVVVDNGSCDDTAAVVQTLARKLPIRSLSEPLRGKGNALNRALSDAPLGEIVAVVDDDMSPRSDWFSGVQAICDRWPDADYFTGRSYIIWPVPLDSVPSWALRPYFRNWVFSVFDAGPRDKVLTDGRFFSGNHFWFRSRVLADGRRFDVCQTFMQMNEGGAEPNFMLQLAEDGYVGVAGPDAVCGHRIQPELLRLTNLEKRALRVGEILAFARLHPYKAKVKHARHFRKHPALARLFCILSVIKWGAVWALSPLTFTPSRRIERRLESLLKVSEYISYLRIASWMPEVYGIHRLVRNVEARLARPSVG